MADQNTPDIIYTKVDEAPQLASASFLPVIRAFAAAAGVSVGTRDISLAGRIIAAFPENLTEAQRPVGRPCRARRIGQNTPVRTSSNFPISLPRCRNLWRL